MIRQNIYSTNIKSVGYEDGKLEIEFKTRSIYQYFNVPENVYLGLLNASSKGTFLNTYIKDRYRFRQIR
ncbi:KTSC domain-containing protein [Flavobacterium yafengii]|uniref:KTSC domain-containing protein n=1 Tax=Flavobacterium yafengii TaxID=3041253 RepID=UPI0024A7FF35|nr:KTSC domain-containing protein [Flavobacterium yafengii]MDI6046198.1 KTSC domain-containing protein [Flavobacterium yafengii]